MPPHFIGLNYAIKSTLIKRNMQQSFKIAETEIILNNARPKCKIILIY